MSVSGADHNGWRVAWRLLRRSQIPRLFTLEEVEAASAAMLARIAELEAQVSQPAPSNGKRRRRSPA
jgi:hypothetical protein